MKIAIVGLLFLTLSLSAATFNVRDFGATGDGQTLDTAAIQKALNACENTGGTVEFPAGNLFESAIEHPDPEHHPTRRRGHVAGGHKSI